MSNYMIYIEYNLIIIQVSVIVYYRQSTDEKGSWV